MRNGRTGLFRVEEDDVTEVAIDGTVLPDGLGTLGDIGAFSFQYAILPNGDVIFKARATDGSLSPAFLYTFRWRRDDHACAAVHRDRPGDVHPGVRP